MQCWKGFAEEEAIETPRRHPGRWDNCMRWKGFAEEEAIETQNSCADGETKHIVGKDSLRKKRLRPTIDGLLQPDSPVGKDSLRKKRLRLERVEGVAVRLPGWKGFAEEEAIETLSRGSTWKRGLALERIR